MNEWQRRISILQTRKRGKLRLSEIAARIGMSVSGLSEIKQGRTKEPRLEAALKLRELCKRKMA